MAHPMGESKRDGLRVDFDRRLKLEFHGSKKFHALAYNLGNFMRALALPKEVEHWSLTTLREKLVKIGAKVVRHGRYVTFQLAEVAVSKILFQKILALIDDLRRSPVPA